MYSMKEIIKKEVLSEKEKGMFRLLYVLISNLTRRVVFLYRISCFLRNYHVRFLPGLIQRKLATKYGVYISQNAQIGVGLKFPHPTGIVIGDGVVIGSNCTIYQQVTLGGKQIGDAQKVRYPNVGENVTIFAGAKLIARIRVGSHSTIGANSVVNKDVPEFSIAVGVPARIIKTKDIKGDR